MDKKFIKDVLTDSDIIHGLISETNNNIRNSSRILKNVSMTLKIENNRILDKGGIATGIAPIASEIERVSKDMNIAISDLVNNHRPRLYECNNVIDFILGCMIENDKIDIDMLMKLLKEKSDIGQKTITSLELSNLALKAGKFDPHDISDKADIYMRD